MRTVLSAYVNRIRKAPNGAMKLRAALLLPRSCSWNAWLREITARMETQPVSPLKGDGTNGPLAKAEPVGFLHREHGGGRRLFSRSLALPTGFTYTSIP